MWLRKSCFTPVIKRGKTLKAFIFPSVEFPVSQQRDPVKKYPISAEILFYAVVLPFTPMSPRKGTPGIPSQITGDYRAYKSDQERACTTALTDTLQGIVQHQYTMVRG